MAQGRDGLHGGARHHRRPPGGPRASPARRQGGLEAGLLRSDDYDLGTNLWIVYAGRFDTQSSAEQQAANLGERYPGAYATLVKPAG